MATEGAEAQTVMRFAVVLPWWGYVLAFGAAVVLGWLAYARVPVKLTPGQRVGLTALRALTLILLIAILLRPVVMVPPAAANNSLLPVLVDVSRSMRLRDRLAVRTRLERAQAHRRAICRRSSAGIPHRAADVRRDAGGRDRRRSRLRPPRGAAISAARSPTSPSVIATTDSAGVDRLVRWRRYRAAGSAARAAPSMRRS